MIDKDVFCEGHKELIIETFGVDHFPIQRLTNEDDEFAVGGRFSEPIPKQKGGAELCAEPAICSIPLKQAAYCATATFDQIVFTSGPIGGLTSSRSIAKRSCEIESTPIPDDYC